MEPVKGEFLKGGTLLVDRRREREVTPYVKDLYFQKSAFSAISILRRDAHSARDP